METPKIYFPYCLTCDEWTRPHRIGNAVYCSSCGVWRADLPTHPLLAFGKHKGRSVYQMTNAEEKSYLRWMLEKIERIDLGIRLAILYQLDYLPDQLPAPTALWWAQSLSLTLPCTADEVKRAYREASKTCHPDAGGTTEQMQRLNEAKELATAYLESK